MTTTICSKLAIKFRCSQKIIRIIILLLIGLLTIPFIFSLPQPKSSKKSLPFRQRLFMHWLSKLQTILCIRIQVEGGTMQEPGLFVSNHISWLDVPLQCSQNYAYFVAKQDVRHWPVIGWLTKKIGTIFIDRSNKFSCYRHLNRVEGQLKKSNSVFLYPESTTSNGKTVLPFYTMFYEAACRVGTPIQPVMICYSHADGSDCLEVAFIDDQTFVDSLIQITKLKEIFVTIKYLPPISIEGQDRKQLATYSHQVISETLTQQQAKRPQQRQTKLSKTSQKEQALDCTPL